MSMSPVILRAGDMDTLPPQTFRTQNKAKTASFFKASILVYFTALLIGISAGVSLVLPSSSKQHDAGDVLDDNPADAVFQHNQTSVDGVHVQQSLTGVTQQQSHIKQGAVHSLDAGLQHSVLTWRGKTPNAA